MKTLVAAAAISLFVGNVSFANSACYTSDDVDKSSPIYLEGQPGETYKVKLSGPIETFYGTLFADSFSGLSLRNASHPEDSYYVADVTLRFAEADETVYEAYLYLDSNTRFQPSGISIAVVTDSFYAPTVVWHYPLTCE